MSDSSVSKDVRESFPEDWEDWVLVSLTELEASERVEVDEDLLSKMPSWAGSMVEEVLKPMLPSIRWKIDGQTGPEFLGKMLGHQEYLLESEEAGDALEMQVAKIKNNQSNVVVDSDIFTEMQRELLPVVWPELIEFWGLALRSLIPILEKKSIALKRCRSRAFEQSFEVAQEFNKAYAEAQSISLYTAAGDIDGLSSWNKVRMTLLIFTPLVDHPIFFKSIPDLYRWMLRVHKRKIISSESFRKLCNGHGLSCAKNREK